MPILFWVALLLMELTAGCYKEIIIEENPEEQPDLFQYHDMISLDGLTPFLDQSGGFMLFPLSQSQLESFSPLIEYDNYRSVTLNGTRLKNGVRYDMGSVMINHAYELIFTDSSQTDSCNLIFTTIPTLRITINSPIRNDPKVLSWMELQYPTTENGQKVTHHFETYAGIEIRGNSSTLYDKKAFGIELWKNIQFDDREVPLLGMRSAEDWILDAMYMDKLRMRNKLSFEIWEQLYNQSERRELIFPGIHLEYVELFINNSYQGIYCLGEKLTEQLMGFYRNHTDLGGAMYKAIGYGDGSTMFRVLDSEPADTLVWDDWEQMYPVETFRWEPLADLRQLVVHGSDEEFKKRIGSLIDLNNAADYYLWINMILGYDNVGKNVHLAQYSRQDKMFIIPWDADATWGRMWDMTDSGPEGNPSNNLLDRLIELDVEGFNETLRSRWAACRKSVFRQDSIMQSVNRYYRLLSESGAIERENTRWEDVQIDFEAELDYITGWIGARIDHLDNHFN